MLIRSVKINNYRNYNGALFELDPYLNIIIGKNGTGKTNLLESIVVISNTKSFRTNSDQDLIKKGTDYARIDLSTDKDEYRIVINKKNKSLYINNNLIKKTSDFIGRVNANAAVDTAKHLSITFFINKEILSGISFLTICNLTANETRKIPS